MEEIWKMFSLEALIAPGIVCIILLVGLIFYDIRRRKLKQETTERRVEGNEQN